MNVLYRKILNRDCEEILSNDLLPEIILFKNIQENIDVLIDGYPSVDDLVNTNCSKLIIPFAGLPARTKTLLTNFPKIEVYNLHHNSYQVAEMIIGFIFSLAKHLLIADKMFRNHDWSFRYGTNPSTLIKNSKILFVGYGKIAKKVEKLLSPFNCDFGKINNSDQAPLHLLNDLVNKYDIVINTLPSTDKTMNAFTEKTFERMKQSAFFINVGRAVTVDEEALYTALSNNKISGAALDVWYNYPSDNNYSYTKPANLPFHELENVIMSPHRAGGLGMYENEISRTKELVSLLNDLYYGVNSNRINLERGY